MRSLPQIVAVYKEIAGEFQSAHGTAKADGDEAQAQRIEEKRVLNDQAWFVLCWDQLEAEIDEACRLAIARRKADASWEM